MRTRTAFAVVLLSGLACLGVPSAAADELATTPAETSESAEPDDETTPAPSAEPSDVPTSEVTAPEAQDSATPTQPADQPQSADEIDDTQAADEGAVPGETETPLPTEAQETNATEESLTAAAEDRRDPRASIGDINCNNLTVPVTLDNSRSTEGVVYEVHAGETFEFEPTFEEAVQVPTGATQVVNVPVSEDTRVLVNVYDHPAGVSPWGSTLAVAILSVDCTADDDPHDPQARIGGVDCARMTVDVTLDNSRSEGGTSFYVTISLAVEDEPFDAETRNVPAGDVQTLLIPVTENVPVVIAVRDASALGEEEGILLADELFRVNCTPGDEPEASIGEVNCANRTVPVTLDNTRSEVETWFGIFAGLADEFLDDNPYQDSFPLAPGAERVVSVPVPNNAEVLVIVHDVNLELLNAPLARDTFEVDCERTVAVRAVRDGRTGVLAATGANGLTLPIAGFTLLAGGAIFTLLARRRA